MTREQEKEQREALKLEISSRKELAKRLDHPLKLLATAEAKEKAAREARVAELSEYKTESEIMDAYGYDMITDDERRELLEALETGKDFVENTATKVSIAHTILKEFVGGLKKEIRGFEFELLPREEQIRRMEANDKHRAELSARAAAARRGEDG